MTDTDTTVTGTETVATERKRAAASNFLPIVRGRLPLIFVHAIRFDSVLATMGNKDVATKFGTSIGKVFDIRKGRNFGYIDANFKPSTEDVTAANAWIAQAGAANAKGLTAVGDKALMQDTLDSYTGKGLASAEDVAKVSEARVAARKPKAPKAEKAEKASASASAGADLLA